MNLKRLVFLLCLILTPMVPAYYFVNYFTAGIIDQHQLIEFSHNDTYFYCQKWRPSHLNINYLITGYGHVSLKVPKNKDINWLKVD